jgi:hypothetical protein
LHSGGYYRHRMKTSVSVLFSALLFFSAAATFAQEAVTEKPASEPEVTTTEESTPVSAPEQRHKPKSSHRKSTGASLRDMMTQEEFQAMGLDKLTPTELEHLTWWMQGFRRGAGASPATRTAAAAPAAAAAAPAAEATAGTAAATAETKKKIHYPWLAKKEAIYSRVDGMIGPLTGRSIITLEDGTKWKQANADDRYRPQIKDHPPAAVLPTTFGWKMRIEGMPDFYVNPVMQ